MAKLDVILGTLSHTYFIIRNYSVTIVVILIPLYVISCDTRPRNCRDSAYYAMRRQEETLNNRDTSAGQVHNYIHQHSHFNHRHTRNLSQVDSVYIQKQIIEIIGDRHCPPAADYLNSSVVHMCPLYHAIEYDENRIPSVMRQVGCRCATCVGPFSEGETQCVLVMSNILVERVIGCDSNTHNYQYAQVWEPVSTDCECRHLTLAERHRNVMPP